MTVYTIIGTTLPQYSPEITCVQQWLPVTETRQARNDARAEFHGLLIERTGLCGVNEKIHRVLLAINMAKYLHEPCFYAPAIKTSHYLKNLHLLRQTIQTFAPSDGNCRSSMYALFFHRLGVRTNG